MKQKPKIAFCWLSSCGGCEESIVDLSETLLAAAEAAEILFWPVALDYRYEDLEKLEDQELDAAFINGSVRMDDQEELAHLFRKKSKRIFAHGTCAHLGGVVGLANLFPGKEGLNEAYLRAPTVSNPDSILPKTRCEEGGETLALPGFHPAVKALHQVIDVEYSIPGCPPTPELVEEAILGLLEKRLPSRGSVLAEKKALCHTCPLNRTKPERIQAQRFYRIYEKIWDPNRCFLDQGLICLGPSTRGGCKARCIQANFPCRGCFGPLEKVRDQGAATLSFLASLMHAATPEEIEMIADSIPDPAGLFYRYSLPSSRIHQSRFEENP
ncbi:MAG: oxidoreductase [Thermodesulfobacteriota bacterium]